MFNNVNQSFAQDTTIHAARWYIGTNPLAIPMGFSIKAEINGLHPLQPATNTEPTLLAVTFFVPTKVLKDGFRSQTFIRWRL